MMNGKAAKIYYVTQKGKYMIAVSTGERERNLEYEKRLSGNPEALEVQKNCFVDTKSEANQKRRDFKKQGRCSCYTKTIEGIYYVTSCPKRTCPLPSRQ